MAYSSYREELAGSTMRAKLAWIVMVLAVTTAGHAALRRVPTVPMVLIDPDDPARIFAEIRWQDGSTSFAASSDYGIAFHEIRREDIPVEATQQLWHGEHRYTRFGRPSSAVPEYDVRTVLLHFRDGGRSWESTALHEYVAAGAAGIRNRDLEEFLTQYSHRAPKQRDGWASVYVSTWMVLVSVAMVSLRRRGWSWIASHAARTVLMALIGLLLLSHTND